MARQIALYKVKPLIYTALGIALLNSYLWYQLSTGFFDNATRYFLFIIFNQIFFLIALVVIYFYSQLQNVTRELEQLKYIISRIKK